MKSSLMIWHLDNVKSTLSLTLRISSNFVAFLENMNLKVQIFWKGKKNEKILPFVSTLQSNVKN